MSHRALVCLFWHLKVAIFRNYDGNKMAITKDNKTGEDSKVGFPDGNTTEFTQAKQPSLH